MGAKRSPITMGTESHACIEIATLFPNSLIIDTALTQPEHLILVRWIGLETQ